MSLFTKKLPAVIKGCKANKRPDQEALYKLFYTDMLRLCYRYLKSDELAQEALNAGFLKVFQNIGGFNEQKGEPGAWIHAIMVNTCIDLGRKEARFNEITSTDELGDEAFVAPEVLDKLYVEDLLIAIRTLPAATQLVFNLSVLDGYAHHEIAEQLHITESTSRWHLSEAKKQLRTLLQPKQTKVTPTENPRKAQ
ncbi:RNA polymerase sigma factor [Mucilaginibacter terrae]|uniref:RNA polymerase sigma factor (Sigma-70 family) n=1 Tax=Mucilaginibacter terrae TaxID=1955052 RepID=A0ABU3GWH9_9SPHI|nr:RNA polymerase sigma factor [Mucilaginibacter terrae]MDT3404127.1 RNA polymerase sigma factor (sigma-70 family) [Mucilaginibacter terrae]